MRTHYTPSLLGAALLAGVLCAVVHPHLFTHWISHLRWRIALLAPILAVLFLTADVAGQTLTLTKNATGIMINPAAGNYSASFGTMNALAVGTPSTGVTAIPLTNGTLYYTLIDMTPSGLNGHHLANISANLTSIGRPAAFTAETCPAPAGCTASTSYTALTTTSSNALATGVADGQTVTSGLAIFVSDNNGATFFAGTDTIVITYTVRDATNGHSGSVTLTLTVQSQTAVGLTLGTAPSGATIATALDFSLDFGNVNGLGIGPASGFTTSAVAGGVIYSTPYLLQPAFAEFLSTSATIKVALTTPFGHPTVLDLRDASVAAGPYTSITSTQRQITNTAANRSSITRYLGLFVSNVNGASSYRGADNATLTFTLTVP